MVGKRPDLDFDTITKIKYKLCKFKSEDRKKIVELYKTKSATSIGNMYGVGAQIIQTALRLENIEIRNRKQSQQHYLKRNKERSLKQSKFMKDHNPMHNS
ncbi:hypothetical protein LCGC14_3133550, partial [marine sediment metagenome]